MYYFNSSDILMTEHKYRKTIDLLLLLSSNFNIEKEYMEVNPLHIYIYIK